MVVDNEEVVHKMADWAVVGRQADTAQVERAYGDVFRANWLTIGSVILNMAIGSAATIVDSVGGDKSLGLGSYWSENALLRKACAIRATTIVRLKTRAADLLCAALVIAV